MIRGVAVVGMAAGAWGQGAVSLTVPPGPLLPATFGQWKAGGTPIANAGGLSLSTLSKAALEECGPQRSQVGDYVRNGQRIHVEAVQFGDRTGAFSAFTLAEQPGMKPMGALGANDAAGNGAILFTVGTSLVAVSPATAADAAGLKPLAEAMPKVFGNKGVAPLLPSLVLKDDLVKGSVRYAIGPETYAAQGGVLPANSLAWDKSAEAVTAQYAGERGQETMTLLLYPTPEIAGSIERAIESSLPGMGPQFAGAKVRREGELVVVASGSLSAEDAQRMVNTVHLRQQVSIDKEMGPEFHGQVRTTVSLLVNVLILSGVLMLAAIVLAVFLGGGRALVRVLQGKPAAAEVEFLSLHLSPQNKPAEFTRQD
ncbi:MAG: DUF6599 family protein [Acidobacteriota bacterium]